MYIWYITTQVVGDKYVQKTAHLVYGWVDDPKNISKLWDRILGVQWGVVTIDFLKMTLIYSQKKYEVKEILTTESKNFNWVIFLVREIIGPKHIQNR